LDLTNFPQKYHQNENMAERKNDDQRVKKKFKMFFRKKTIFEKSAIG